MTTFRQRRPSALLRALQDEDEEVAATRASLESAIAKRRYVYRHGLYAKHVASNRFTKFIPPPTPFKISSSTELQSRATAFIRRELRVWVNLDSEFLASYILTLIKTIDLRCETGVKLLAEMLDVGTPYVEGHRHLNAEHFAHGESIHPPVSLFVVKNEPSWQNFTPFYGRPTRASTFTTELCK